MWESSERKWDFPTIFAEIDSPSRSDQITQAPQADFFPRNERFAKTHTDSPAPVPGTITEIVQQGRRCGRPAFDELRPVAGDGLHLAFDVRSDIHDKRRPGMNSQVNGEVIKNPLGIMRRARHVRFCQLGPK